MEKHAFEKWINRIEKCGLKKLVIGLNGSISVLTGFLYAFVCFWHLCKRDYTGVALMVCAPAVSFLMLTVMRKKINAKRPYEIYGFVPLLPKETQGNSFPSRHVFSIFVIASTLVWWHPLLSAGIFGMGILLAALRVLTGVHFPKDVIAGAGCGILCGMVSKCILYFIA